jgi:hypothetical protein
VPAVIFGFRGMYSKAASPLHQHRAGAWPTTTCFFLDLPAQGKRKSDLCATNGAFVPVYTDFQAYEEKSVMKNVRINESGHEC